MESEDRQVITQKQTLVYRQELTPVSFLERAGAVHADRIAAVDGDRRYTYREWRARSRRMAHALRAAGLRKGDRVAFLALNSEPLLLGHFGVLQAGGVIVAVNTRLSADEVGYILDHSGAELVFSSPELEPLLAEAPAGLRRVNVATELGHSWPPAPTSRWSRGWRTSTRSAPSTTPLARPAGPRE